MTLNKVPFVPNNEPLLGVLDRFQEGRSHMAIVSRFSVDRAKSVKKAVKQSLTQRVRQAVGVSDDSSSSSESEDSGEETGSTGTGGSRLKRRRNAPSDGSTDRDVTLRGKPDLENDKDGDRSGGEAPEPDTGKRRFRLRRKKGGKRSRKTRREKKAEPGDIEMGEVPHDADKRGIGGFGLSSREQITPADAVLAESSANEVRFVFLHSRFDRKLTCCTQFLQILDAAIMPLGIITLEDVLEGMFAPSPVSQGRSHPVIELIGEEIYDEFDPHHRGAQLSSFIPPDSDGGATVTTITVNDPGRDNTSGIVRATGHDIQTSSPRSGTSSVGPGFGLGHGPAIIRPIALKAKEGFGSLTNRSRSAPPVPREQVGKRPPSQSGVSPKIGDHGNKSATPPVDVADEKSDAPNFNPLSPHPANPTSILGSDSQPPGSQPQTPVLEPVVHQAPILGSHLAVSTPSRSVSPASLEAYFLERKRRGGSGGGVTPRIVSPAPGAKGKGFKSSPLSPVERDTVDGAKRSKGIGGAVREVDGSAPPSEALAEDNGLS